VEQHTASYIRYHSGVDAVRRILFKPKPLTAPPEVFFLFGKTGMGKSTIPERMLGDAVCRLRPPEGSDIFRVDGYDPAVHEGVLIEEFVDHVPINQVKLLCGLQVLPPSNPQV